MNNGHVKFVRAKYDLFLYALPPNQPVEIEWQKPLEKAIQANECGLIIIKASADTFSLENQIIMPGFKFNIREVPKTCTELAGYPQIFETPTGAIAIGGKVPNRAYSTFLNHEVQ